MIYTKGPWKVTRTLVKEANKNIKPVLRVEGDIPEFGSIRLLSKTLKNIDQAIAKAEGVKLNV